MSGLSTEAPATHRVDEILQSDIGVSALLTRLKQAVASTRDFAAFLKKRASLEEENAQGLRKLSRSAHESLRRPDSRQGSYSTQFDEALKTHDRLSDNGSQFASVLHTMHDELLELALAMDRGRKHWKQFGSSSEKRVHDAEQLVEKAKAKYDGFVEEYDRVRTGDRRSGKPFGFSRSGAGQEEELHRRVMAADADYASKVNAAKAQRQELVQTIRPQAINALREMVFECDSGLTTHLQKYAQLTERLILSNALNISPIKSSGPNVHSMREVIGQIDNAEDFNAFILNYSAKLPTPLKDVDLKYEPHPSFLLQQQAQQIQPSPMPAQQHFSQSHPQAQHPSSPTPPLPSNLPDPAPTGHPSQLHAHQYHGSAQKQDGYNVNPPKLDQPIQASGDGRDLASSQVLQPQAPQPQTPQSQASQSQAFQPQAPQLQAPQSQTPQTQIPQTQAPQSQIPQSQVPQSQAPQSQVHQPQASQSQAPHPFSQVEQPLQAQGFGAVVQRPAALPSTSPNSGPAQRRGSENAFPDLPPTRPVFGIPLDQLLVRDDSAIPIIVYQCIQSVDLFGLDIEGIYRLSGDKRHVERIKAIFNHNAAQIDFRRPEDFFHDVNSVASVLKQFFRDLPEPLMTDELYPEFITAARIGDDTQRRDSLHGLVNQLPDPNYATLRVLILHLHRVQEHSNMNRMTVGNLAICFGPTLMGSDSHPNIADASLQVKVIETILTNCFSIFHDDEA